MQTATNPAIETSVARTFPAEAMSATSARHFVVAVLGPLVRDDLVAVAALLTTELTTNSLLHACSAVDVHVERVERPPASGGRATPTPTGRAASTPIASAPSVAVSRSSST